MKTIANKISDIPLQQLREILAANIRCVGPNSESVIIIRREIERREAIIAAAENGGQA